MKGARRRSPWIWFIPFLVFEYWLLLQIPETVLSDSRVAAGFVRLMDHVLPVVHQLDRLASKPEVLSFFLAISPLLLVPKIIFWVEILGSDKLRMLRYFVVSPLTTNVPKNAFDFVTDPLRDERENRSTQLTQPIGLGRRIFISIATLMFALFAGLSWPWFLYGTDVVHGRPADFRVLATAAGGWRLWLSWSVYQMNVAAGFLAISYYVLADYVVWLRNIINKSRGQ